MGKNSTPRESSNSSMTDNYLEKDIKRMIRSYNRLEKDIKRMIRSYNRLEKLNPHKYRHLLNLIIIEEGEFISTPRFMEAYYGILNKDGENTTDIVLREKEAVNHYRRDLEEAISEEPKK